MPITSQLFGHTRRGAPVTAYRMHHPNGACAVVLDYGGTVQSLCVPDRSGRLVDVVLGYDTVEEYEAGDGYVAHRDRQVSQALKAFAAFARSADKGATRDPELINKLSGLA